MAKLQRLAGSTSHVIQLFLQDSTKTDGSGLTGLAFGSPGLTCWYKRNRGAASVSVTLANITTLGTYVSGGFKEVDPTNLPGLYEFHPPDAALAAGSGSVAFVLKGAANMAPVPVEIELTGTDNQDAVAGGLGRIDAAISSRLAASTDLSGTQVVNSAGGFIKLAGSSSAPSAAAVAAAVWDEPKAAHTTAGTFGFNLDTTVTSRSTFAGGAVASVTAPVTLTTGERNSIATAYLDLTDGIETGKTPRQTLRGIAAVLIGNKTGEGTTAVAFAAAGNSGTPRVAAALDSSGNRTNTLTL